MVPISNTGSVPKTVTWYWHFVCNRAQFFHMAGHFTKKCFYFMIFDCYLLKLSVSKNWQLFSNFNTRQFWSQKQPKTNWAHFFEHKERPQCANIWQSLPMALENFVWFQSLLYETHEGTCGLAEQRRTHRRKVVSLSPATVNVLVNLGKSLYLTCLIDPSALGTCIWGCHNLSAHRFAPVIGYWLQI